MEIKEEMEKEMDDLKKENGMDILESKYQRQIGHIHKDYQKIMDKMKEDAKCELGLADQAAETRLNDVIKSHFEREIELQQAYHETLVKIIGWLEHPQHFSQQRAALGVSKEL